MHERFDPVCRQDNKLCLNLVFRACLDGVEVEHVDRRV